MTILKSALEEIRRHGEDTYPEECCGFLIGMLTPEGNRVSHVWRVENQAEQLRTRRYRIHPDDYRDADRYAAEEDLDIVGFYHSHPDHPARPSETDLAEATLPGYSYVIVSVLDGKASELTAWSLAPDRSRFHADPIDE
jgi:proteasome lid subunit RPN8/RPN11